MSKMKNLNKCHHIPHYFRTTIDTYPLDKKIHFHMYFTVVLWVIFHHEYDQNNIFIYNLQE